MCIRDSVGTSLASLTEQHNIQDHPHACGDKACLKLSCDNIKGSSPRVWGQVRHGLRINSRNGIIPTRVGTSVLVRWQYEATKDHPHACGDKGTTAEPSWSSIGSSPRVWGQDEKSLTAKAKRRIIPTRVGTSASFDFE